MNTRALKLTVFFSLLLNMLLIGVMIGYFLSHDSHPRFIHREGGFNSFLKSLPEEKAVLYRDHSATLRKSHREQHRRIRHLRQQAVDVLIAEPFDTGLFKQKLLELHRLRADAKQSQSLAIVQLAEQLSVAERRALSEHLLPDHRRNKRAQR